MQGHTRNQTTKNVSGVEQPAGHILCTRRTVYIGISIIIGWSLIGNQGNSKKQIDQYALNETAQVSVSSLSGRIAMAIQIGTLSTFTLKQWQFGSLFLFLM